jgi:F-type H+-transporting ATPase subunit epsilon
MYLLSITTPEKVVFEDQVYSLIAPGTVGYLEILTDHAPIITSLQPGKLIVTDSNGEKLIYAVSGGFLEVSGNKATLLADAVEVASQIDLKRAEAALERARQRIESRAREIDIPRTVAALRRAENRIKIHGEYASQPV